MGKHVFHLTSVSPCRLPTSSDACVWKKRSQYGMIWSYENSHALMINNVEHCRVSIFVLFGT